MRSVLATCVLLTLGATILFLITLGDVAFTSDVARMAGITDTHLLNATKLFFMDHRMSEGDFPLWNPHSFSGAPFAAHPLSMAFYPPNLIRSALVQARTPEKLLFSLYMLAFLHQLMATLALYPLARLEGVSSRASAVLALAVPFSFSWIDQILSQFPAVATVAWTPVILLGLRKAIDSKSRRRGLAWIAVAGTLYGFQILGGFPQIAIYATLLYIFYVALHVGTRTENGHFSLRRSAWDLTKWAPPMILFGLLGAAIAMALILPAAEFMRLTARSHENFSKYEHFGVNRNSSHFFTSALIRAKPDFFSQIRAYAETIDIWISLNVGLLIAAIVAVFSLRRRMVLIQVLLFLLLFDLCYGPPMPFSVLFQKISPFAVSSPFYCAILMTMPLGILAGFGLDALFDRLRGRTGSRLARGCLLATGAIMILLLVEPPGAKSSWTFAWSLLPVSILLLMSFGSKFRHWQVLVCALLVVEVAVCGREFVNVAFAPPFVLVRPFLGDPDILKSEPDGVLVGSRSVCERCNRHVWSLESAIGGYDPLLLDKSSLIMSNPGEELTYTRHIRVDKHLNAGALLKRRYWLVPAYVKGPPPEKTRPYPPARVVFLEDAPSLPVDRMLLGDVPVGFIDTPGEEIEIWNVESDPMLHVGFMVQHIKASGVSIPQRNSALFMYYQSEDPAEVSIRVIGGRPQELFAFGPFTLPATEGETRTMEFPLPDFTESEVNLFVVWERGTGVPVIERVTIRPDLTDESDRIHVIEATPDRIVLEVRDAPGPRILLFTDVMYPGWEAALDGLPVPILEANGAFKAVEVPEGTHEIRFEFRPRRVYAGVTVSLGALGLSLVAMLVGFWPARATAPTEIESHQDPVP